MSITVTTATQVQAILISYIGWGSEFKDIYANNYLFDTYIASVSLTHTPPRSLTDNLVDFYGFNGFIVDNNGSDFSLSSAWDSEQFSFSTLSKFRYLSFNYFFYIGTSCS